MKLNTWIALVTASLTVLVSIEPAKANRICIEGGYSEVSDESYVSPVRAGERFHLTAGEGEPFYIDGDTTGSQVRVRSGPGTEYASDAYGLVGEDVTGLMFAFDSNCGLWFRVRFPVSGYEGWIHSDYAKPYYPRGLFD